MDQKELAGLTGISENSINKLYNEKSGGIRWETLNELCRVLGCQPGDFLAYVPDSVEPQKSGRNGEKGMDQPKKKRGFFGL